MPVCKLCMLSFIFILFLNNKNDHDVFECDEDLPHECRHKKSHVIDDKMLIQLDRLSFKAGISIKCIVQYLWSICRVFLISNSVLLYSWHNANTSHIRMEHLFPTLEHVERIKATNHVETWEMFKNKSFMKSF